MNDEVCLCLIKVLLHQLQITYCGATDLDPDSSGSSMSESGGDSEGGLDGGEGSGEDGIVTMESIRLGTPALRERGLIEQMEEEVVEAGLRGWFNGEA